MSLTAYLRVRVTESDLSLLDRMAEQQGFTRSQLVRHVLIQELDDHQSTCTTTEELHIAGDAGGAGHDHS